MSKGLQEQMKDGKEERKRCILTSPEEKEKERSALPSIAAGNQRGCGSGKTVEPTVKSKGFGRRRVTGWIKQGGRSKTAGLKNI